MRTWGVVLGVWCLSVAGAYRIGASGRDRGDPGVPGAGGGRLVSEGRGEGSGGLSGALSGGGAPAGSREARWGHAAGVGRGWERAVVLLEQAARIAGDEERDREMGAVLSGLGPVELAAMLGGMELEAGPVRSRMTGEVLDRWSEVDAAGALAFVEGMEGEAEVEREALRDRVLERWSMYSPEAAWAWVLSNGAGQRSERDLARVIAGSGEGDPERMFAFLESHREAFGKAQLGAVGSAVRDAFMNGFGDEVRGWVEGLGDGAMRDAAVRALAEGMGRYDAEAAYAWVEGTGLEEEQLAGLRVRLAESWARLDPRGAAEWVASENGGDGGGRELEGVMRRWLATDYEAAATWLAGQEPSPALDLSLERYITSAMRYDAAETWAWAESITDEKRRYRAFEMLARRLRDEDPAVLERTVLASSLSDEAKLKMLGVKLKETKPARARVKEKTRVSKG